MPFRSNATVSALVSSFRPLAEQQRQLRHLGDDGASDINDAVLVTLPALKYRPLLEHSCGLNLPLPSLSLGAISPRCEQLARYTHANTRCSR